MEGFLYAQTVDFNLLAVKGHQHRTHAEGTCLVKTSAARCSAEFSPICNVHLSKCAQVKPVELIESPGDEYTDCRAR